MAEASSVRVFIGLCRLCLEPALSGRQSIMKDAGDQACLEPAGRVGAGWGDLRAA